MMILFLMSHELSQIIIIIKMFVSAFYIFTKDPSLSSQNFGMREVQIKAQFVEDGLLDWSLGLCRRGHILCGWCSLPLPPREKIAGVSEVMGRLDGCYPSDWPTLTWQLLLGYCVHISNDCSYIACQVCMTNNNS